MHKSYLITGGAGFIGSHLAEHILNQSYDPETRVIVVDSLDYAANIENLKKCFEDPRFSFYQIDINDKSALISILQKHQVNGIFHLAAKSHVDDSIENPTKVLENNLNGAISLISSVRNYFNQINDFEKANFKFINISTDEVFGDRLGIEAANEQTKYCPSSPYSASKAGADLIFESFARTYDIPILTLYLPNNFGPRQYPEKLIPLTILQLLYGLKISLYGDGKQIRGWMYVKDTVTLIFSLINNWNNLKSQKYTISGELLTNLQVVNYIAQALEELYPLEENLNFNHSIDSYKSLIDFTADRPGHDRKYEVQDFLLQTANIQLPLNDFSTRIKDTILWYIDNSQKEIKKLKIYTYKDKKTQI
ncbi:dTDP-glucose 4,6-dehydratase [Psittacicella gerlachiana]|uniref:NAD(P)-binding domain-containing protein n=1 Tax=Psittacicella gerlachiana TaxID=2028574 RepID=A0A3A1Y589_9GAMM|nr:GDP-mannose 4,6-dehydratase [Psittacicella gerlachiana]RIY32436.1 hypothetical protein CKF59_06970 [Psittacicella gerlachiana]